jgi:molybdopterin-synthase adenylyltransferase
VDERYHRHYGLFGAEGQARLAACRIGIAGVGGLGSPVVQQLSHLGVTKLALVDEDVVDETNLNRLIGATPRDVGRLKVDVAADLARAIQPGYEPFTVPKKLEHRDARDVLQRVHLILACVDEDVARLQLLDLASSARVPHFDLATDIVRGVDDGRLDYGGRVLWSGKGDRCAFCMDLLDQTDLRRATMTDAELEVEARIYGVPVEQLKPGTGPSVVSVNGVVASLAVTEIVKLVTGLGDPSGLLHYVGAAGVVRKVTDAPSIVPCPYCARWGAA